MTRLEIEIGEIVLRGVPAEYADDLGPLVEERLSLLAGGPVEAHPDGLLTRGTPHVADRQALADLVAHEVWAQTEIQRGGG